MTPTRILMRLTLLLGQLNENQKILQYYYAMINVPAGLLVLLRIGPTTLNFVGLATGILSGILVALGNFTSAFVLLVVAGLADALDGAVARRLGITSDFGNFIDSVFDRYVDTAILLGVLWYFAFLDQILASSLAALALVGTTITSYTKARGESLGIRGRSVGFMNRPERILVYLIGLLFPAYLPILLWPLAILTNVTAVHRIIFYLKRLRQQ